MDMRSRFRNPGDRGRALTEKRNMRGQTELPVEGR